MRKAFTLTLVLPALAVFFAGCGAGGSVPTPPACVTSPGIWLTALAEAPDQVLIEDATPIADCLPADQAAAHQEEVGRTVVEVATILARGAKGELAGEAPTGARAAVAAGYLVGALEKAAGESQGIHASLVDRVKSAATNGLDGTGQQVQAAYGVGYEAGLESG